MLCISSIVTCPAASGSERIALDCALGIAPLGSVSLEHAARELALVGDLQTQQVRDRAAEIGVAGGRPISKRWRKLGPRRP